MAIGLLGAVVNEICIGAGVMDRQDMQAFTRLRLTARMPCVLPRAACVLSPTCDRATCTCWPCQAASASKHDARIVCSSDVESSVNIS